MRASRYWMVASAVLFLAGRPLICRAAPDMQTKDCGWCAITCPGAVATGEPFDIRIDLKGPADKADLAVDLHYMKKDGSFGGMLAWGGGAREVSGGTPPDGAIHNR